MIERLRADTIPVVTVLFSPSGAPIAMVSSPTFNWSESPIGMGVSGTPVSILMTATSLRASTPMISEDHSLPSVVVTRMVASASCPPAVTTWALVMM
ncbi:MAG: Uncharacterised protein [Cellulomonadaceae bacterium TMED98]|nr:MAG: Uncharacterised protein [Cellulomonadaceae bacterium TMED98]